MVSRIQLFVTPSTVAYQAPLSMEFSRQEYRSGLPFPSPGNLPNPEIEPRSLALQVDDLPSETPGKPFMYLSWHRQWEPESMHGRQAAAGREAGCTACGPSWSTGAVHHGWGACQSHCLCVASISIYWELQHKNLLNLFWSCRIPSAPSIDKA